MAIHYLMMGMERHQVWWGLYIGQLGITLEVDLHSMGPGASKTHPGVCCWHFFPVAISSGVCWNQPGFPDRWTVCWRLMVEIPCGISQSVLCFSVRERPPCSVSNKESHLVPRAWHRALKPSEFPKCEMSSKHTLSGTPRSLLMRAFGELPVSFPWRVILR